MAPAHAITIQLLLTLAGLETRCASLCFMHMTNLVAGEMGWWHARFASCAQDGVLPDMQAPTTCGRPARTCAARRDAPSGPTSTPAPSALFLYSQVPVWGFTVPKATGATAGTWTVSRLCARTPLVKIA